MRFHLLFCSLVIAAISCNNVHTELISVTIIIKSAIHDSIKVEKEEILSKFEKAFAYRKKEPCKFMPDYKIKMIYKNGLEEIILLKDNYIKIDGMSYRINNRNITRLIEKIVEDTIK